MLARPSADQPRLSIIDEDSDTLPPLPSSSPNASHRPFSRRWRDRPPAANYDNAPPKYSVWDVSGPRGEKLMDVRNNKYIVKRGGWKRLCVVFLIVAIIAIALGVGLGVGLHQHNKSSGSQSLHDTANKTQPFPIGSYSLNTSLDTVSTGCTANAATWLCHPYITYNASASGSGQTFNWIIQGPLANLSISSSDDPFGILFANASLTLRDRGTDDEHYFFSIPLNKVVHPVTAITDDESSAACYFNGTIFAASLYTKKAAGMSSNSADGTLLPWQHAIEIVQTIHGGQGVPSCFKTENGGLGARVDVGQVQQPAKTLCECAWRNFDL